MPWWDLRSLSCVRNLSGIFQDDICRRLPISTISNDWFPGAESLLIEHWNEEGNVSYRYLNKFARYKMF
ncbi:hypothetical protein WN943_005244 [Citrus x changshan-huyou]